MRNPTGGLRSVMMKRMFERGPRQRRSIVGWLLGLGLLFCLLVGGLEASFSFSTGSSSAGRALAAAQTRPQITLNPAAGPPQTAIVVTAQGFTPGDTIAFYYVDAQDQGTLLGTAPATMTGTVQVSGLTIPPAALLGGVGLIVARDTALLQMAAIATAPFAVTPLLATLNVHPSVAVPGSSVLITGSGFAPGVPVQVRLFDAQINTTLQFTTPITSSATGTIGPLSTTIPLAFAPEVPDRAVFAAQDAVGTTAAVPATIVSSTSLTSTLQLRPPRAVLGVPVHVLAGGFEPVEPVDVSLTGAQGTVLPVSAFNSPAAADGGTPLASDSSGNIDGVFIVPEAGEVVRTDIPGSTSNGGTLVTVTLRGERSGNTLSAPLLLGGVQIRALPSTTTPGHPYVLQGSGFAAGEVVNVAITDGSGNTTLLGHYTAAACAQQPSPHTAACLSGSFAAVTAAPRVQPGAFAANQGTAPGAAATLSYQLAAVGQTSGLIAAANLTLTHAPALTLSPYVAAPGQSVVVEGSAFTPNSMLRLDVAFPAGASSCAAALPDGSLSACGEQFAIAVDQSGAFRVAITIPLSATAGPVAIDGTDSHGDQASTVLTVSTQTLSLHAPLFAHPGQVLALTGTGFASGETVDMALVTMGGESGGTSDSATLAGTHCGTLIAQPLPNSTITGTADALGGLEGSYPLPQPFTSGTYYLIALGETSGVCAFTPITIANAPPTPLPTPTPCPHGSCGSSHATPTPTPLTPSSCAAAERDPRTGLCMSDTVTYFAEGSTAQVAVLVQRHPGYAGLPCAGNPTTPVPPKSPCISATLSYREELHLLNKSDHSVEVEIAYLLYGLQEPRATFAQTEPLYAHPNPAWVALAQHGTLQVQRLRSMILPPHGIAVRSVNADVGDGHLVSIILRAGGPVAASAVERRILLVGRCPGSATDGSLPACAHDLDAASSTGSKAPTTTWFFPQGYVGGAFDEYLTVLNPQTDASLVQIRAVTAHGTLPGSIALVVQPFARETFAVQQAVNTLCIAARKQHGKDHVCPIVQGAVSLQVISTEPIVAERVLYWGEGSGPTRAGFDVGTGASAVSVRNGRPVTPTQYVAYASTLHGDQAYLALLNPTIRSVTATVRAFSDSGLQTAKRVVTLPAQSSISLDLAGVLYPGLYALAVQSPSAIEGEVAQYSGGSPQSGAHPGLLLPLVAVERDATLAASAGSSTAEPMTLRVWNVTSGTISVTASTNTPTGTHPLAQYRLESHAVLTLQETHTMGMTIHCSGSCVGASLAGAPAGGEQTSAWGTTLQ